MYGSLPHDAKKRLSELEQDASDQFDARLLSDRVFTHFAEDAHIRRLVHVTELAYNLDENNSQPEFIQTAGFDAAERLNEDIDDLVDVVVARILAEFLVDVNEDWFEDPESTADEAEVEAAVHEAREWLQAHTDAVDCAGLTEELGDVFIGGTA